MKIILRILSAMLFVVFLSFALKNTQEVALQFFMGYAVHAPLVLWLLVFFALGAAFGVLSLIPTVFRYRRQVTGYRKTVAKMEEKAQQNLLPGTQSPPDGAH